MYISKKMFKENFVLCKAKIDELILETRLEERRDQIYDYFATYEEILDGMQKIFFDYVYSNANLVIEERPKLSVNLSPQASGKSQLNNFAASKMQNNCIVINSDELKMYYPKAKELSKSDFSVFFTYITDIGSNLFTSTLLLYALNEGYNVVFEGTGRTSKILVTIEPFRTKYKIKIRTIVVASMTSLTSIMLRYIKQKKNSECGRLVRCKDFLSAYNNIIDLIKEAESKGHIIEVFARGKQEDSFPLKLYSSKHRGGFADAVSAVKYAREYNWRLSKDENIERLKEVKEYCGQNSWKENIENYSEIVQCFYYILFLSNEFEDDLEF